MAGDQISYRPTVFKLKGEQHQFVKVRVNSARTGLAPLIALADGYRISPVFLDVTLLQCVFGEKEIGGRPDL